MSTREGLVLFRAYTQQQPQLQQPQLQQQQRPPANQHCADFDDLLLDQGTIIHIAKKYRQLYGWHIQVLFLIEHWDSQRGMGYV